MFSLAFTSARPAAPVLLLRCLSTVHAGFAAAPAQQAVSVSAATASAATFAGTGDITAGDEACTNKEETVLQPLERRNAAAAVLERAATKRKLKLPPLTVDSMSAKE